MCHCSLCFVTQEISKPARVVNPEAEMSEAPPGDEWGAQGDEWSAPSSLCPNLFNVELCHVSFFNMKNMHNMNLWSKKKRNPYPLMFMFAKQEWKTTLKISCIFFYFQKLYKMVKKADEILDELFTQIKVGISIKRVIYKVLLNSHQIIN